MKRYITVASVTQAIKGRDILRKNGFKVGVKKSDSSTVGCAYTIVLENSDIDNAVRILNKYGINVKSVS